MTGVRDFGFCFFWCSFRFVWLVSILLILALIGLLVVCVWCIGSRGGSSFVRALLLVSFLVGHGFCLVIFDS